MIKRAHNALPNAYAPYSKFTVAACILTENNHYYTGVNVENASYGLTSCAETSAICTMVSSGDKTIQSLVVLAGSNLLCSPCGSCRQKIYEFSTPGTMVHLCSKDQIFHSVPIKELLPLAFDFKI